MTNDSNISMSCGSSAVEVIEVGFTKDHMITEWATKALIDNPDGTSPTWRKVANPDQPAAYTKGTLIEMFAKFAITPPTTFDADIRVRSTGVTIARKDRVTFNGSMTTVRGITATVVLGRKVGKMTPFFDWEISLDGGITWQSVGSTGPHTLYWTSAAPITPPFTNFSGTSYEGLYDLALDKACIHVNRQHDRTVILDKISVGVDLAIFYNPKLLLPDVHPLVAYTPPNPTNGIVCGDFAHLLRGLARSIGIDCEVTYIWGGSPTALHRYTIGSTGVRSPTFRILRHAHGAAGLNPHFSYHAVVKAFGLYFDPSYGMRYEVGSVALAETAFNTALKQESTTFPSSDVKTEWVCPH